MDKSSSENVSQFSSQRYNVNDLIPEHQEEDPELQDPAIREMIQNSSLKGVTYEQLIKQKNDRIKDYHDNNIKLVSWI